MSKLIIDTPSLQSLRQRYTATFITFVFWVLWFYLWIPLITFLGWWFQAQVYQYEMITIGGFQAVKDAAVIFLMVTTLLPGCLALWSFYNLRRFKGFTHDGPPTVVTSKEIKAYFSVSDQDFSAVRAGKVISIDFDEQDKRSFTIVR